MSCRNARYSSQQLSALFKPNEARTFMLRCRAERQRSFQQAQKRSVWSFPNPGNRKNRNESLWQPRTMLAPPDRADQFSKYPLVTAKTLRNDYTRPREVKMLMRDFIEDSLYNLNYGYFSKQAIIFSSKKPFEFQEMANEPEFHKILGRRYTALEDSLDETEPDDTRQLWHTPTELFKPHYGESIARYLIENYRLWAYPYHDLIIYEIGAGNGTLMLNILDYIRRTDPDVYTRTQYRIIEVSTSLAAMQQERLKAQPQTRSHTDKVQIINRSVFDWNEHVSSPCFFLALEVIDNFAHDAIRYDLVNNNPLQCYVLIDEAGEFYELYTHTLDPVTKRFLRVRDRACSSQPPAPENRTRKNDDYFHHHHLQRLPKPFRRVLANAPLLPNLTAPEYIPTRLIQLFEILRKYFPRHNLLCNDFHTLPGSIAGHNAPIVQTRYKRRTVPVTTPLVKQGYFDILFPTDFDVMEQMYRAMTGKLTRVIPQQDFLMSWADVEATKTKNGENPMLMWYSNASVMVTV